MVGFWFTCCTASRTAARTPPPPAPLPLAAAASTCPGAGAGGVMTRRLSGEPSPPGWCGAGGWSVEEVHAHLYSSRIEKADTTGTGVILIDVMIIPD